MSRLEIPEQYEIEFPDFDEGETVAAIVSGGMDSTVLAQVLIDVAPRVVLFCYDYGQKQVRELECVKKNFGGKVEVLEFKLPYLKWASEGVSANVSSDMLVPDGKDVEGNKSPVTEVPWRNLNLLVVTASMAEKVGFSKIMCGFQFNNTYWDTTEQFVNCVTELFKLPARGPVEVFDPLRKLSKKDEIYLLFHLYGPERSMEILSNTLSCYNPSEEGSCGVCKSCVERLQAFKDVGFEDPIVYRK